MADTLAPPRLLTAEEFLDLCADGRRAELIDGEEVPMPPAGEEHGRLAMAIMAEVAVHAKRHGLGRVVGTAVGYRLTRDPDTVREPDGAFRAAPCGPPSVGFAEEIPELVLEVVSPTDRAVQVQAKVRLWLEHGVHVVWVAFPELAEVVVHRADSVVTLGRGDTLTCDDLLPGFALPLAEVFGDGDG